METFTIFVQSGVNLVEVGECDADHISLITLTHAICEKLSGCSNVPTGDYHVWAQIPWSGEKYGVGSDSELLELFSWFEEHGLGMIVFELEDLCYIPTPPEEPQVLDVEGGYEPLDGFEGYQSKSDDEYFTDLELEAKQHDCHRVYNKKEAKVKWIASKFEKLVKSNPSIDVNVIGDLLREKYKVSVEIQRLYRAKHRALKELAKNHANCFRYLRRYAYMLSQSNPSVTVHICTQDPQPTFQMINLTFMFDRQKGVIAALELYFPFAHRRFAYDPVIRCDHVTNNMTETFNSMLGSYRAASYLDLLEFIRRMIMRKFNERKEECRGWSLALPPRVHAKILKHSKESRTLTIIAVGNMEYELLGASGGYAVKLREYNCQCGSWQVSGIPCCYAMAAISHYCGRATVKDKVAEFVHSSLTKSAYLQTYVGMLHPIPDQKRWPEVPACILIPGISELMNLPPRIV
ncbi:hypothetical protein EZV62_000671 [Acer yangbiense]|uniref:Zinc finger PMZ-type domain-containing protein n=1 Tax=Acer yangbiense TaxID=1000413 RepID=A0A5C7IUC8_9ROSI|nr:hypothetical protein EZV62_000671 [Acer yangbiense]